VTGASASRHAFPFQIRVVTSGSAPGAVRIRFQALGCRAAGGRGGRRVHQQHALVARGDQVRQVQVPRQHRLHAVPREGGQRAARAHHRLRLRGEGRRIERVVRDDDACDALRHRGQPRLGAFQPRAADPPLLPLQVRLHAPRGVEADHRHLPVLPDRLGLRAHVAAPAAVGVGEALHKVVLRDVVVAGHRHEGGGQGAEEGHRRLELVVVRALRQVAGHRDQVGLQRRDVLGQRGHHLRDLGPEVQVGQVRDQPGHAASAVSAGACAAGFGTMTLSAPGWMR
jgi:hypothetical protein